MTGGRTKQGRAAGRLTGVVAIVLLVLAGCRPSQAQPAVGMGTPAPPAVPSATAATTLPPPPAIVTRAATEAFASFSLPAGSVQEIGGAAATGRAEPTPAGATVMASEPPALTATPTGPTGTPQPTFTAPAPAGAAEWEHFWLARPAPQGVAVWTNKVYPYGSTRGGTLRPHHGVEFDVPSGTPVLAAAAGMVVVAGADDEVAYGPTTGFYGNLVVIQHDWASNGQAVFTLYGHLTQVSVAVGQRVQVFDVIGYSGATGAADGAHLHFEVRLGQNSYANTRNPLLWIDPFAGQGVVAGRVVWPDGALVVEASVSLRRVDAPGPYLATTTYAGASLNADDGWGENFAIDDVPAGYYEVVAQSGRRQFMATTWVYPSRTSFVEIVMEPGE